MVLFRAHAYIFVWGDCMPGIVWYSLIFLYGIEYNALYIAMYTTLFCAQSYLITAKPGPPMASTLVCTYPSAKKHIHPIINLGRKHTCVASLEWRIVSKHFLRMEVTILCVACSWKFYLRKLVLEDMDCMSRSNTHFPPVMQNSP